MAVSGVSVTSLIEFGVVALIVLAVVYIVLKMGKNLLKWVFGIIINSILGFLAIFILNFLFSFGIPFTLPIIVSTALFGLPAVGTLAILKLGGAALAP